MHLQAQHLGQVCARSFDVETEGSAEMWTDAKLG